MKLICLLLNERGFSTYIVNCMALVQVCSLWPESVSGLLGVVFNLCMSGVVASDTLSHVELGRNECRSNDPFFQGCISQVVIL